MNSSGPEKASGCSIFITLLLVIMLFLGFLVVQNFLQPEDPGSATKIVDDGRTSKINQYEEENSLYSKKIDIFHEDKNSSLDAVMEKVTLEYQSFYQSIE